MPPSARTRETARARSPQLSRLFRLHTDETVRGDQAFCNSSVTTQVSFSAVASAVRVGPAIMSTVRSARHPNPTCDLHLIGSLQHGHTADHRVRRCSWSRRKQWNPRSSGRSGIRPSAGRARRRNRRQARQACGNRPTDLLYAPLSLAGRRSVGPMEGSNHGKPVASWGLSAMLWGPVRL